ncbi:RBBP9/YdeN family alpha/beta hydrolase [Uniformispora flossi]|uniref:RBBP9/YdeN family alpha/beta hydrolase n=1 Tax=Uniformispora flossi TaxID=3390723 RepID=UPI003C2C5072
MSPTAEATVVVVPGLRDHVPEHWQTLLAERLAAAGTAVQTVPPPTADKLSRTARVAALDAVLAGITGPVLIAAHSAGAVVTAHWAQDHRPDASPFRIRGALLATPPDLTTPLPAGHPTFAELERNGWLPVPRTPLPFPSLVAASSDDPLAAPGYAAGLARDWGSRVVELGAVGHLNPASGFGAWPRAEELLHAAAA